MFARCLLDRVDTQLYSTGKSNRVSDCLAGVMAKRAHLCRVAGSNVWSYGRWRFVALRWLTIIN